MAFEAANHFVVRGTGIDGVIDLGGISGEAVVSLKVDGRPLRAPGIDKTSEGIVVKGVYEEVPDGHTIVVTVAIPEVNIDSEATTAAGFAVLTTARTSIGGPHLVSGPLHLFELRPLAVTASIVES